jgi:hypothetical protein
VVNHIFLPPPSTQAISKGALRHKSKIDLLIDYLVDSVAQTLPICFAKLKRIILNLTNGNSCALLIITTAGVNVDFGRNNKTGIEAPHAETERFGTRGFFLCKKTGGHR